MAGFSRDDFRAFLVEKEGKSWRKQAKRIVTRVAAMEREGMDLDEFMVNERAGKEAGEKALGVLERRVRQGRMAASTVTQYRAALNALARFAGYETPMFGKRTGPKRPPLPKDETEVVERARKYMLVTESLAPKTVRNHTNAIKHLARDWGLDLLRFCKDDLEAQDVAEEAILERLLDNTSPEQYNDDIDALTYLAKSQGLEIHLKKRKETYRFDPDPAPIEQVRRLVAWEDEAQWRTRIGRAAAMWFLYATKRPEESSLVDLSDFDLTTPDEPEVKINHPGKRGTVHTVLLPAHMLRKTRPFGAYYRWRSNLQDQIDAGEAFLPPGERHAFWLRPAGANRYRRVDSSFLGKVIGEMAEAQGVRMTATRLRKTGLTMIANGRHTDFLDAFEQANHQNMNSTRAYVFRSKQQRRRRLAGSQKDVYTRKDHDE